MSQLQGQVEEALCGHGGYVVLLRGYQLFGGIGISSNIARLKNLFEKI